MKEFKIGKTKIGAENPCFVVAEIGINYDGKYEQALQLIDVAAETGCNAVKFQLFRAGRMYPQNAGKYKIASGEKRDILEIIRDSELPFAWLPKLRKYSHAKGLEFFSSVCDEVSADMLEKFGTDAYKITSSESSHIPLIRHVAKKNKPVIISFGMAKLKEIAEAVEAIENEGNNKIVIMHCVAVYPAPLKVLNLRTINMFKQCFPRAIVGFSDHSRDPAMGPKAAVALGAKVVEKHITLDRRMPGPDHSFALNPRELKSMVKAIRDTENKLRAGKGGDIKINSIVLGKTERNIKQENYYRSFLYRTIFAIRGIRKGEKFTSRNIAVLRPGKNRSGLEPKYYDLLMKGYRAVQDIPSNKSITWDDILTK